ncbi:hypothetical protein T459_34603 [Capsicum annuum]|uniref:Uncharacterized protein n=1 Tax=Capsicum annuum TaxID=4072 RepID=A0A2G2XVM7_CAPAN|nr:hypothetical protein T459_34603 [Capsicum annuum]
MASYSSGHGTFPDGRVSAQFSTVTRLLVHPASPVLLTKNGLLGALDSVARIDKAVARRTPKSDKRFACQYRCGPPPEFPLASPRSGIVHYFCGPNRPESIARRCRSMPELPATIDRTAFHERIKSPSFGCPPIHAGPCP